MEDKSKEVKAAQEAVIEKAKSKRAKVSTAPKASMVTRLEFIRPSINGTYSEKELKKMLNAKFTGNTPAANGTLITDSKNPKYAGFKKVTKLNKKGFLHFSNINSKRPAEKLVAIK